MASFLLIERYLFMRVLTTADILEKGNELNRVYANYKEADRPRDKKMKWRIFFDAAEQYRQDFAEYLRANPADITKTL